MRQRGFPQGLLKRRSVQATLELSDHHFRFRQLEIIFSSLEGATGVRSVGADTYIRRQADVTGIAFRARSSAAGVT